MGKLVSLKMTEKEAKGDYGDAPISMSKTAKDNLPRYPYETRIRLDTETLKKLGIKVADYPAGLKCTITAEAEVYSTEQRETQGNTPRQELCLQITDISVEPDRKTKRAKADSDRIGRLASSTDKY
jgi:hypothetical protein